MWKILAAGAALLALTVGGLVFLFGTAGFAWEEVHGGPSVPWSFGNDQKDIRAGGTLVTNVESDDCLALGLTKEEVLACLGEATARVPLGNSNGEYEDDGEVWTFDNDVMVIFREDAVVDFSGYQPEDKKVSAAHQPRGSHLPMLRPTSDRPERKITSKSKSGGSCGTSSGCGN